MTVIIIIGAIDYEFAQAHLKLMLLVGFLSWLATRKLWLWLYCR
jgi:hypothetical protein